MTADMERDALGGYEAMAEISGRMLGAARESDWDRFIAEEKRWKACKATCESSYDCREKLPGGEFDDGYESKCPVPKECAEECGIHDRFVAGLVEAVGAGVHPEPAGAGEGQQLAELGDRAAMEQALRTYANYRDLTTGRWDFNYCLPLVRLGERTDEVIARLAKSLRDTANFNRILYAWARYSPEFDPIRGDPRFEQLLREVRPKLAKPFDDEASARPTAPAPDPKSVAVLAFANLSNDPENEYFSDGIADELLTVLQKIPGLRVAARTSAFSFKGKSSTAKEVGEKLGMAHVVEGSVQKSGKRVKITARLSRAATNEEVWSESFGPLEMNDIFVTQSEIAQKIVAKLRGQLTGETAATTANVAPAVTAEIKSQVQAAAKGGAAARAVARLAIAQGMPDLRIALVEGDDVTGLVAGGQLPVHEADAGLDMGGGGMLLALGVCAAIIRVRLSGEGQVVDAAIVDGSANMMNLLLSLHAAGAQPIERGQGLLDGPHWYNSFVCADGHCISLGALEPHFYAILLDKLGLKDDPGFQRQFDGKSTGHRVGTRSHFAHPAWQHLTCADPQRLHRLTHFEGQGHLLRDRKHRIARPIVR